MEDIEILFLHNVDPRRRQELADARMAREDHTQVANLPQKPIYHQFDQDRFVEQVNYFNRGQKKKIL
jgi:hypothetical protein